MVKWKRDMIYGIIIIVAAIAGAIEVRGLNIMGNPAWITRPDAYVWMWLAIMAAFAIALVVRALRKKDDEVLEPIWCKDGVITIAAMFLYLLVMDLIGFTISTFIFETGLILLYSYRMGKLNHKGKKLYTTIALYLVVALIATLATQYLFTEALSVRLPKGKIF